MSRRRCDGKTFHTRGMAAEKFMLPKLLCVRGTTHILSDADRSRGRPVSAVSWMLEARYDGVCPASDWWTRHASLNSIRRRTGSQCNFYSTGVMRSRRRVLVIRRTDWTDCRQQVVGYAVQEQITIRHAWIVIHMFIRHLDRIQQRLK